MTEAGGKAMDEKSISDADLDAVPESSEMGSNSPMYASYQQHHEGSPLATTFVIYENGQTRGAWKAGKREDFRCTSNFLI
jgi:hypothetical protein